MGNINEILLEGFDVLVGCFQDLVHFLEKLEGEAEIVDLRLHKHEYLSFQFGVYLLKLFSH